MIIFDVETTGLSPTEDRIFQLSYIKTDNNFNVIYAKNFFFAVDYISEGASEVTGFTVEKLKELSNGYTFEDYANEIYYDFVTEKDLLIAHNISFDYNFMKNSFDRVGLKFNCTANLFCTMKAYTNITKLNYNKYYRSYKWPRLFEVITYLIGKGKNFYMELDHDRLKKKTMEFFELSDSVDFHDSRYDIVCTLEIAKIYFRDYNGSSDESLNESDRVDEVDKIDKVNSKVNSDEAPVHKPEPQDTSSLDNTSDTSNNSSSTSFLGNLLNKILFRK